MTAFGELLPKFKVQASPKFGVSGGALCVKVIVPKLPENRRLAVAIDCDRFYRSWQDNIDGEQGPGAFDTCVDAMPAGQCVIGATVYRSDPKAKFGVSSKTVTDRACFAGMDVTC